MALSMFLLYVAQRTIAIGTAYVVWTGIGAVGTLLMGIFSFRRLGRILAAVLRGADRPRGDRHETILLIPAFIRISA